jgi:hypothetical protein
VAEPSSGRIFISYRREETAYAAGWLFNRLADRFGPDQVFKDVDSIELGDDFVAAITSAVGSTDVLLALIGDTWLTVSDDHGVRRLDDPEDFVRLEIEAALTRNIRVIPILVDGASMPSDDELPPSLAQLARRQALELSPSRFDFDTSRLLEVLDKTLAEVRHSESEPIRRSAADGRGADTDTLGTAASSLRRRLSSRPKLLLALGGAALLVVAVFVALLATRNSNEPPAAANSSVAPIPIPFSDEFSTQEHQWSGGDYVDGGYLVSAERGGEGSANTAVLASPQGGSSPGNLRITVDAQRTGGTARVGFGYGVFCKRDSANNRYAFVVWHTMATVEKRFDGRSETLGTFAGVKSLSHEEPSKELQAVCESTQTSANLQFWVDGTMIIDATDPNSPLEGQGYGLQVDLRASDAPQAHTGDTLEVRFDDFQVSR